MKSIYQILVCSILGFTALACGFGCSFGVQSHTSPTNVSAVLGESWPVNLYEAESGTLSGTATVVGASDQSSRADGDLGGEASARQAVSLTNIGDSVSFTVSSADALANAIVVRYSIPDGPVGGGTLATINLSVESAQQAPIYTHTLNLNSRYSWLYGGPADGVKLYNVPVNAGSFATSTNGLHIYDEVQLRMPSGLAAGDTIQLSKTASSGTLPVTVDFIELETVPAALAQPTNYISIADPSCGAVSADTHSSGLAFDGSDDSSYASVFNWNNDTNPYNPISYLVFEKVWYSNAPQDSLQDTSANALTSGLSLFQLADQNFQSLQKCLAQLSSVGGSYSGIWIPPGRYFTRGALAVPSNTSIQGAGMWYSKFVAVDTMAPTAVTVGTLSGYAGISGNLVFLAASPTGSNNVTLANFSMFGNVTQRDVVDAQQPWGVHGLFTNSTFDNLWIEHYFIGVNFNSTSNNVRVSNTRVRNTFADGLDFYQSTSNSLLTSSQARSTGDDGFAIWSSGSSSANIASGNTISNSISRLQWYGNGFAIYGGNNNGLVNDNAYDILNYPGVQISTNHITTPPAGSTMTAFANNINLYRSGGNGFSQSYGALLLGSGTFESVAGVSLNNIQIYAPAYKGIDIAPSPAGVAAASGTFSNITVVGPIVNPVNCAAINSGIAGNAQFNNVCYCATALSSPIACPVTNSSGSYSVTVASPCSLSACH